jgi:transposase InsO family protein
MSIDQNCLIEFLDGTRNVSSTIRVLQIVNDDVVTIQLYNSSALPLWQRYSELEAELIQGSARILEADPFSHLFRPEETIPELHRKLRDERYQIIAPIVESGLKAFDKRERGALIRVIVDNTGVTRKTIYFNLRLWWCGGQKPNTLLAGWDRCGGKGKERLKDPPKSEKGKGFQPPDSSKGESKHKDKPARLRVDKRIRKIIVRAAKLFHEKNGMTLKDARQRMLERFFAVKDKDRDGNEVPLLFPVEKRPSQRQFNYWYYEDREDRLKEALIAREGQKRYNTTYRELLSNTMKLAPYPGAFWQIDSTVLDIYVVSSLDRSRIIGRPVLYLVVDVFSRMIVGFSLALEGPSWFGAALALENATADKVQFCGEFGITILPDEWPCQHLCKFLLTDRGSEYLSNHTEHLKNALNITLIHTPAYRPDWKPIVERKFRTINDLVIHWEPGAVRKPRDRGDPDYRLDAIYTLHELRKIIIHMILFYNNYNYLEEYPVSRAMIEDHVELIPNSLWDWGVVECGRPRREAADIIRLNLLPTAEATVTRHGISLLSPRKDVSFRERLLYNCDLAAREQWCVKAVMNGSWRIPVAYNPRKLDEIYLRLDNGRSLEICSLLEDTFTGCDSYEAAEYFVDSASERDDAKSTQEQGQAVLNANVDRIREQAEKETKAAAQGKSKRERLEGSPQDRREERDREGASNAWQFESSSSNQENQSVPDSVLPKTPLNNDEYVPPPQDTDLIDQMLKEAWENG